MTFLCATTIGAQVRPDSAKRTPDDPAKRLGADTAAMRAAADSAQSVRNALAQARVDSIARLKAADTIKAPFAQFERPDQAELSDRLKFSRE